MSASAVRTTVDERGVAHLSLARPDRRNAISGAMCNEIALAATRLEADPAARVVVLMGEGRLFCAGGDLGWMRAQFATDRAGRTSEARRLVEMLYRLNVLSKPLIGRVQGAAFGGGVGLLCVCDAVIAADDACFGMTETRLGLIPATISPYVIARLGEGPARRVFFSGASFDCGKAVTLGLVSRAVPSAALDEAVAAEVEPYLAAAHGAVAAAKRLARSLGSPIDETTIAATVERLADTWETAEARDGIEAFFERRAPPWAM